MAALVQWCNKRGRGRGIEPSLMINLPVDRKGECIFHSSDARFKERSGLEVYFKKLLKLALAASGLGCKAVETLDCDDFIFTGRESSFGELAGAKILDLSEVSFPQPTSFIGAQFKSVVWFTGAKFGTSCLFENVRFEKDVFFDHVSFGARAVFTACSFVKDAAFRETQFHGSTHFTSCEVRGNVAFNETHFHQAAAFVNCKIGRGFFHQVKFERDVNDGIVRFDDTVFTELAQFRGVSFSNETSFKRCKFTAGEFLDTTFSGDRLTSFDGIGVQYSLLFKNIEPSAKAFSHTVSFDVKSSDIKGHVTFENVNLFHIQQSQVVRKLASAGVEKFKIGVGCDRYKLRVELRLPLEQRWKFLVEEMSDAFVLFYEWSGKIPIQVSVECEYEESHLLVRYFADSDITQKEFAGLLEERVPAFIELLKDPEGYFRKREYVAESDESTMLAYDVFRKVLALNLGISPRVEAGILNQEDVVNILKSLGNSRALRRLQVNFYNSVIQKDFFSIGTKKMYAGNNLTYKP